MLRLGGIFPTYWRRKRASAKWHRGFRQGSLMVRSQCEKIADSRGARVIYSPIEEPWPTPHCRTCETATPGSDAVRDAMRDPGAAPVTRSARPRTNSNHQRPRKE